MKNIEQSKQYIEKCDDENQLVQMQKKYFKMFIDMLLIVFNINSIPFSSVFIFFYVKLMAHPS